MTDEQIARLPKWAQREVGRLQRQVADLQAELQEVRAATYSEGAAPDSPVLLTDYEHGDVVLPEHSRIQFSLGDRRRVDCRLGSRRGALALEVTGYNVALTVHPWASNAVLIDVPER